MGRSPNIGILTNVHKGFIVSESCIGTLLPCHHRNRPTVSKYRYCTIHKSPWRRQNKVKVVIEIYNTCSTSLPSSERHDQYTFKGKVSPATEFNKRQQTEKEEWKACRSVEMYQSL